MTKLPINQIICGDCVEIMKEFPSESIDLILTDPPWNIGRKHYDTGINMKPIIEDFKRIIKQNGHICLEIGYSSLHSYLDIVENIGLFIRQPLILYCVNGMLRRSFVGWNKFSIVLWVTKNESTTVEKKYMDVIPWVLISSKSEGWEYPNPKNVVAYSKLVRMFSKENNIVLDPFAGSGTTLIACKKLNRKFIGIEIEQKFVDVIKSRLSSVEFSTPLEEYFAQEIPSKKIK